MRSCVTTAFFAIMKHVHLSFDQKASLQKLNHEDDGSEIAETPKQKIPMANLLPQVKKQLDVVLNPRANSFLDAIGGNSQLCAYAYEILTAFEQL